MRPHVVIHNAAGVDGVLSGFDIDVALFVSLRCMGHPCVAHGVPLVRVPPGAAAPVHLRLKHVGRFDGGEVWLPWDVLHGTDARGAGIIRSHD